MLLNACKRLRPRAFPFDRARPPVSDMCFDCTRAIVTYVIMQFTKCNCRGAGLDMVPGDIAFKRCGIEFQFIVAFFFCAMPLLLTSNFATMKDGICISRRADRNFELLGPVRAAFTFPRGKLTSTGRYCATR